MSLAISPKTIHWFQRHLLAWYVKNKRDLPWRKTRDPYKIFVSEVMLQQTQVDRVIPKYREFLKAFPTVQALARAPLRQVIRLWSGLGYNRRAVHLHRCARMIVTDYHGKFPSDSKTLQTLPGVGRYTAEAIRIFAFQKKNFTIDTNIRRVLHRWFFGVEIRKAINEKRIEKIAEEVVPHDAYSWHHGMMDFGALVCKANGCSCPFRAKCKAYPAILSFNRVKFRSRKRKEPFHNSTRFFRGRIIEALRQPPHRASIDRLEVKLGRPLRSLIQQLERDGLVRLLPTSTRPTIIALP